MFMMIWVTTTMMSSASPATVPLIERPLKRASVATRKIDLFP